MTRIAGLSEAQLHVIGIGRAGVVGQVTRYASRDRNVVVVVLVAIGTLPRRHGMHSSERKTGHRVIEFCIQPVIEAVAVVTGEREVASRVVGISRILEISLVAAIAVRRHRTVLTERSAFVACVTVDSGVCPHQGEPIIVLFNLFDLYLPSFDRMTLLAIGAEQALVDVGVTGGALSRRVGEDGFDMTLRTSHRLVHTPQGITGAIVIEFWYCSNWFPAERRVAVLARHIQRPVWTSAIGQRRLGESRDPRHQSQRQN
jgi:hypothetical protein